MERPTLRDVARAAGVSHMTVQRAVNGSPLVSDATAKRVRRLAQKLGYRPDPALSALSAYRWKQTGNPTGRVLAFIDCDGTPYSRLVLAGAQIEAGLLGYDIHNFPLPSAGRAQAGLSHMLYHRGVRGVLFGPSGVRETFAGWNWDHFAAASLGALSHEPPMNAVAMDYFQGATTAVEYLHGLGCKRIGLVIESSLLTRTGHRWLGGCLATGIPVTPYTTKPMTADSLKRWVERNRIDGIATIHAGVHKTLREAGIRFVFLNADDCPPGVPHVKLDPAKIGLEGVRLLHHALLRGEFGSPAEPKMVLLRGSWVAR